MLNQIYEPMVKNSSQVHTTTDYWLFKSLTGNRQKNLLHLARLKRSIQEKYLFTVIIVNENYEIIDGQHRFEILQELGLPINYIICEGYGLEEVQRLNANSKNWTADDFLAGYCDLGFKDYIEYRKFKDKYGFGHSACYLLLGTSDNGDIVKNFHAGFFKISDLEKAYKYADLIKLIEPFYKGYDRTTFVRAMVQLLNNQRFVFTEFIQKLGIQPTALVDCINANQYISLIEEIYNYRRREKVNLRY